MSDNEEHIYAMSEDGFSVDEDHLVTKKETSTAPLDLLLTVTSKVFRDLRIVNLNQTIDSLQLQLFYKDFGPERLGEALKAANFGIEKGPACACKACFLAGRGREEGDDFDDDKTPCNFIPWFEQIAGICGLTIFNAHKAKFRMYMGEAFAEEDAHIVTYYAPGTADVRFGWRFVTLGSKLSNAKSIDDPELRKLRFFFRILETFRTDFERKGIIQQARLYAEKVGGCIATETVDLLGGSQKRVDLKQYIAFMELNDQFVQILESYNVQLHVHVLNTSEDKANVYQLIKPCVEVFYDRDDFALEMLDDAYFVLTLSRGERHSSDVLACAVGFWLPYPDNTFEIRYESIRKELLGSDKDPFNGYSNILLSGVEWASYYLARNDPFVIMNLGQARVVTVQIYLELGSEDHWDVWELGPHNVWDQDTLQSADFQHVYDRIGERLMEKKLLCE